MTDTTIKSARRVFEIFEYFDRERRPLGLKEIVGRLGYPPSSGSVLLKSIVAQGYLDYDQASRTYFPTMRIAALGAWVHKSLFGENNITRLMEHLRQATGETVILATQSGLHAQYVHLVHSGEPLQFSVPPGTRRPLANSGMGWLFLSTHTPAEIDRLRRRINANRSVKPKLTQEELMKRVVQVRARGYAFSKGSISEGAGIIAMLLPAEGSGRRFAIGLGGPVRRLERKEKVIVQELRDGIATNFGKP
ncbi:MAG: helix-turn-helix domain-containing protein [Alphaproteobacteria bacterium]|nr:helix-turn-helix domain-containing protein [Alphaproteobacteria bacterium]